jgi:tetratricopeptide (TPR) repeat protein
MIHMNLGNPAEADSLLKETEISKDRMGPYVRIQWDWTRATLNGDREGAYLATKEGVERTPSPIMRVSLGFEALRVNRPEEALEVLSGVDPETPAIEGWPRYWSDLAEALHILGDHERELLVAEQGRGRHPDYYPVLRAEIRAHAALGNLQEVRDLVEEAIRGDVEPAQALLDAALELRAHGNREASRSIGERALTYLGSRPAGASTNTTHRIELLRVLYLLERWDAARAIAEELARVMPSHVDVLGYLGTLAARRGENDDAARISQHLAALDRPYLGGSHTRWRARISSLLGNREQAVSLLRQAHDEGMYLSISIHTDMDLEPLRGHPSFENFVQPKG